MLRVCMSAEGAKNVSWPWLSPLRGWGSLAMAFTGNGLKRVRAYFRNRGPGCVFWCIFFEQRAFFCLHSLNRCCF